MLILFSAATPVGITLGVFLLMNTDGVVEGVFGALATKTFVYIATSEIIVEEFSISSYKFRKYTSFIVGILCILALITFNDD